MNHPVLPFRIVLFGVLAIAQAYLFLRLREAVRRSAWPRWLQTMAVAAIGTLVGACYLLNIYIVVRRLPWVDPPFLAQVGVLYPVAIWNFASAFSALVLALLRSAGRIRRSLVRCWRSLNGSVVPASPDLTRRRFLQAGVGAVASSPLFFATYGAAAASIRTEVEEVSLAFGRRLRVVHLTDIHAGLYMTREHLRRYADLVNGLRPDLVALTGDYISNSMSFLPCMEELARVRARYGTFVTLGNHEHWNGDAREAAAFFRKLGMAVLQNEHRLLHTPDGPVAVAGIDDLEAGRPDLDAALRGLARSLPTILLSHRPEIFPRAAARQVNLTLSGHWHGGQVKVPVLGMDLSIAHLISRYPEGLYREAGSHLYVSRGIGTTGPPIRLNAPPEVVLFHLT
ncbi:MAG: metallophosphoesterase [Candidatus Methylomirabilales bacterium]